jgi:hypothetical protein
MSNIKNYSQNFYLTSTITTGTGSKYLKRPKIKKFKLLKNNGL